MNFKKTKTGKSRKSRELLQARRRRHDPMLVLNMSVFNFEPAWNREPLQHLPGG